jgi:hypothetical protein
VGLERKILALRGFLLAIKDGTLEAKWAMSDADGNAHLKSLMGKSFKKEIDAIVAQFNAENKEKKAAEKKGAEGKAAESKGAVKKDYTLVHGDLFRSEKTQINLWNTTNPKDGWSTKVLLLGRDLIKRSLREFEQVKQDIPWPVVDPVLTPRLVGLLRVKCSNYVYPDQPDDIALQQFWYFLMGTHLIDEQTRATPGLSDHGRCRAIDFGVRGPGVKLDAGGKKRWKDTGYKAKLQHAVEHAKVNGVPVHFTGPKTKPDEPWHYTFTMKEPKLQHEATHSGG